MFRALRSKVSTNRLALTLATIVSLAALLNALGTQPADGAASIGQVDGLWEFTMTLPETGILPEEIRLLANLTRDGSFLNSTTHPPIPVSDPMFKLGGGHGHWRFGRGRRSIALHSLRWVFRNDDASFAAIALSQAELEGNARLTEMSGKVRLQLLDTNKAPLLPAIFGEMAGFRVPFEFADFP